MISISEQIKLFLLLGFLLQFCNVNSQETDFIQGNLINDKDKTPVPFASIIIKGKYKGVITNSDGGFKFPYEQQNIGDTLVISSIGYAPIEIALSSLDRDELNTIAISEKMELLDEVVLIATKRNRKKNATEIVELAINNISKNYPFKSFSYIGYYRDYQVKNGTYLNMNEALMEVFDPGFGALDAKETEVRIYKLNKNPDFPTDIIASRPYDYIDGTKTMSDAILNRNGANEYSILRLHDAIRNHDQNTFDFINRLDTDLIDNHDLQLLPDTFINDVPLYAIKLNKVHGDISILGTVFISKEDYKIYKIQYTGYNRTKKSQFQNEIQMKSNLSKSNNNKKGKLLLNVTIEYQSYKEVMFPSYISFNNAFEALQPAEFKLIDTKFNDEKGSVELTFNKNPKRRTALNKRKYRVWINAMKLKLDSVAIENNVVLLYLKDKKLAVEPNNLESQSRLLDKELQVEVKRIKDNHGNILGRRKLASYNQYREFFVQELNAELEKPLDNLYMRKNQPIFQNQPIAPFGNLSDYWMNTPIQKIDK